ASRFPRMLLLLRRLRQRGARQLPARQRLLWKRYERRSWRDQRTQRSRELLVRECRSAGRDELSCGSPDHTRGLWHPEPGRHLLGSARPAARVCDAGTGRPVYRTPGKPRLSSAHPGEALAAAAAALHGRSLRRSTEQPLVQEGSGPESLVVSVGLPPMKIDFTARVGPKKFLRRRRGELAAMRFNRIGAAAHSSSVMSFARSDSAAARRTREPYTLPRARSLR